MTTLDYSGRCPRCHSYIHFNDGRCQKCGSFLEPDGPEQEIAPALPTDKEFVEGSLKAAQAKGEYLQRTPIDQLPKCPHCQLPVGIGASSCPHCRRNIEWQTVGSTYNFGRWTKDRKRIRRQS